MKSERYYLELADKNEWPFIPNPCTIFNRDVPYIDPTTITIVTGNSAAGKSSFTKYWMYQYVHFAIANNFKLKIIFLCLEETEVQFKYSLKSYFVNRLFGIQLSQADMMCISIREDGSRRKLSKEELEACEKAQQYVDEFLTYIELKVFNDEHNPANPTGVYKYIRKKAYELGTFTLNETRLSPEDILKGSTGDQLIKYHSDYYVMVVVDNVNNLQSEEKLDPKATIRKFVGRYGNTLITKWLGWALICLQQQWKQGMNLDHITAGHIAPSMDGLAVDKDTGNDCRLCIGIFDPFAYEKNYNWPPTTKAFKKEDWKDRFRVLNIPKNTLFNAPILTSDRMIPMEFIGKSCTFRKL